MTSFPQHHITYPFSEQEFVNIKDYRTPDIKLLQSEFAKAATSKGLKTLGIQMTDKKKVVYPASKLNKINLKDGWYCKITDNQVKSRWTVLTVHGAPGDHIEWAGLQTQMGGFCRWINLVLPGFDGEDERRGTYKGSCEDVSMLIVQVMKRLEVRKLVFCGHSMGSIFFTYFQARYPHLVEGYVNITGIINFWYTGLLTFYWFTIVRPDFNSADWRKQGLADLEPSRTILHKQFLENVQYISFGPVPFPKLTITQYWAYVKLINSVPGGLSSLFAINRNISMLQMLVFGRKDPLHTPTFIEETIYMFCDKFSKKKYIPNLLFEIEATLKVIGVTVDASKLQNYFCYYLEDTGHNAHKRRPKQISQALKAYLLCVSCFEKYSEISNSKL